MELGTTVRLQETQDPGRKNVSRTYVRLVAAVAAFSGLLFGFDTAVINGAIVFLRKQFGLTDFQTEAAASALLLGCLFGAAIAGRWSERVGHRKTLMAAGVLFTVSAGTAAFAQGLASFSAARFVGGVAIGLASTLTPVYISEVAPQESRGWLVSMNQLAIVLGLFVAYLCNWGFATLGDSSWRWMIGAGAVPSIAFLIGLLFIPESPRWLFTHGDRSGAQRILERIGGSAEARSELDAMEQVEAEGYEGLSLFSPRMRKRLFVAIGLAVLQQVSGINTVLYYGAVIVRDHVQGQSNTAAIGANVIIGLVVLAGTILAMFFIDRWGRRAILLLASGGMAACLAVLSLAFRVPNTPVAVLFASVLGYVAFFSVGLGPAVWVYIAEIFPTRLRSRATSIAVSALWVSCLAVTLTFLSIVHAVGISATFLLYAILSFVTFVFVWRFVPETRGKSLEELDYLWDVKR